MYKTNVLDMLRNTVLTVFLCTHSASTVLAKHTRSKRQGCDMSKKDDLRMFTDSNNNQIVLDLKISL